MRTIRRDLLKTLSFAVLHFGVAFSVAYALTGSVAIATGSTSVMPYGVWAVALGSAGAYAAYLDPRGWLGINWTVIRPHPPPSNDSVKV